MSGRHRKSRRLLRKVKIGGGIAAVAAVGTTAISLIAATPVNSSEKVNAISAGAVAAAPHAVAVSKPHTLALSEKGITNSLKKGERSWMPTANDAVNLAKAQVGITANASGGGTKFQNWFVSSPWAVRGVQRDGGKVSDYADADWCDMFVSWIGAQLHIKGIGCDAFTPTHAQWFKDQGRWGQTPKPGAIVFYSWSGGKSIDDIDHIGIVIKDNHDGTIQTVEGNTDSAVKIRTRDVSDVVGYGYPEYGTTNA